jgi:hypothetical protein
MTGNSKQVRVTVYMANTPSDFRSRRNEHARARRMLRSGE